MSEMMKLSALVLLIGACAVAANAVDPADQGKPDSKARVASIPQLMQGIVHPSYKALKAAVDKKRFGGQTPSSLGAKASLINEASFMLLQNDRSRGKSWDDAVQELRQESVTLIRKLSARDEEGAKASLKALSDACTRCHAEYR